MYESTDRWLVIAEGLMPELRSKPVRPRREVRAVEAADAFQGWAAEDVGPAAAVAERELGRGDTFTLDFGQHLVGFLTFRVEALGAQDAPIRLKLVFAETVAEAAEPFDPYAGELSRAWLQDEIVNIDTAPAEIRLPRRYAFRYLRVEVVDTSPVFRVRLADIACQMVTSADDRAAQPLPPSVPAELRAIDEASVRTLRNCMQTVFEDGPKRDRRLWLGDLRLQALTNAVTYRNYELVKRCLYLFAGLAREDGLVPACVFERPEPTRGHCFILDYAALFGPTLLDYARESLDWETARDLWPVALRQLDFAVEHLDAGGLFVDPGNWWIFIDWQAGLDKQAAMQGVLMYCLRETMELARAIGQEDSMAWAADTRVRMRAAARERLLDGPLVVSGPDRQVSWASQAWMILGGALELEEGAAALRACADAGAVGPAGPYLWHHVVEAMLACGMRHEAEALLRDYWGGMVRKGASTFWEVYDPADDRLSPYGSHHVNSYCHAWSCTPSWFIRRALAAS